MIQVFRDEHLGEQARGRDALVDDGRRHGRLDQPLAAATDPLAADVPLYLKDPWRVIELLAHILADALKPTAAAALGILRLVTDLPAAGTLQRAPHGAAVPSPASLASLSGLRVRD